MIPQEYIRKKRSGLTLSHTDINDFFSAYLKGEVYDYQASAMLMACFLNPLCEEEVVSLTQIMRDSGKVFSWPGVDPKLLADKHSTGGVGDKTSLIILPLCLLEGLYVPMIAGRGLGHTGGTVDKLESIPGFRVSLSYDQAARQLRERRGFFMGQTPEIAPLDSKLYALRSATATVESIPLIVSSILSKKLAEGISSLVLDVKFGTGAFMEHEEDATHLATLLKKVASGCGLKSRCLLTSMNSPLGRTAGNLLEVRECLDVLRGEGPEDVRHLSTELAAELISLSGQSHNDAQLRQRLAEHLDSGRAYEIFSEIVRAQGGDLSAVEGLSCPRARFRSEITASTSGTIHSCDVRALGMAVVALGGGRKHMKDVLNPEVGLSEMKHVGESVESGEPLCMVEASNKEQLKEAESWIQKAYGLGTEATDTRLIRNII